jgi:hypothetical protein
MFIDTNTIKANELLTTALAPIVKVAIIDKSPRVR